MTIRLFCILIGLLSCHFLEVSSQDFQMDSLQPIQGKALISSPVDIQAGVQVFCNGEYLSFVIEVTDDHVDQNGKGLESDHIELHLALPPKAYPPGFEYRLHPHYLLASAPNSRGSKYPVERQRYFSTYSEYFAPIGVENFLQDHDYPDSQTIRENSLDLPFPSQFRTSRVDYGLVQFAIYPDGRTPEVLNKAHHKVLEKELGIKMGEIAEGLLYSVDFTDQGYIINAQLSPQALGFVEVPAMPELYFAVDVVDADFRYKRGVTVLSTLATSTYGQAKNDYNALSLATPLKTNLTKAPDRVYLKTDYRPTFTYTTHGWIPTAVEVDALHFKEFEPSESLTEVRFFHRPLRYHQILDREHLLNIEQLTIDVEYVNAKGEELEFTIINDQVFVVRRVTQSLALLDTVDNSKTFLFSDGQPGIILTENSTLHPYGWGDCGHCIDERLHIFRIEKEGSQKVLSIEQGEGNPGFCVVGTESYDGYVVTKLNWVKEGQMMVLQLNHREQNLRKRLRVSWNEIGKEVEIEELP